MPPASRKTTVMVVDDEPAIRRLLRHTLRTQDFRIIEAASGKEAITAATEDHIDLVILDIGLPDMDGIEVLRQIRAKSQIPIVMLSVRNDERVIAQALDLGADDYVIKPFGAEELLARIRTALRHRLQSHGEPPVFIDGPLKVDLVRRTVKVSGNEVRLSPKEYELLTLLAANAGKVLTHKFLLTAIWGAGHAEDLQYLRVFVRSLRNKVEPNPEQPQLITTEPGVGYRLRIVEGTE